jgi:glycosyltransferase domain-containing protein
MFDLTVFILTYNRPDDLLVSLRYWSLLEVSVVVADGSPSGPSIPSHLIPSNVTYFHDDSPPNVRTLKALEHLNTKYCVLIGDDEFHLYDGLNASLNLLRSDTSLVASMGQCVGFSVRDDIIYGGRYYDFPISFLSQELPSRIINYFTSYLPILPYAVWRSDVFKLANMISGSSQWGGENVCEWFNSLVALSVGHIAVHDSLQWFRRHDNPTIGKSVSMLAWLTDPAYLDSLLFLRSKYIKFVNLHSFISESDLLNLFKIASASTVFCETSIPYRRALGDDMGKNFVRDYSLPIKDYLLSAGVKVSLKSLSLITDLF